jgi:tripartite-type tricarboxylate transporter receptor subunit TctC
VEDPDRVCAGDRRRYVTAAPAGALIWPERPVRIIVPFAPAGGADTVARVLADRLGNLMKSTFIVDNRPGAGGTVGAEIAASSTADGYTLLVSAFEMSINPTMRPTAEAAHTWPKRQRSIVQS